MTEHVSITMGMDIAALRKAMDQATALVTSAMRTIKGVVLGVAAVVGLGLGFKSIAEGIGSAVRRGKDLDSLARETGRSAEEIAMLYEQTQRAGTSMAEAADMAKELALKWRDSALGATTLTTRLQLLGLSAEQLKRLSLSEQFDLIARAINQLPDQVQRATLATELFGSAGAKAVANYQAGSLVQNAALPWKAAAMGAASFQAKLEELGVDASKLVRMPLSDQLDTITRSLGRIPRESERARAAVAIFGAEGARILGRIPSEAEAAAGAISAAGAKAGKLQGGADVSRIMGGQWRTSAASAASFKAQMDQLGLSARRLMGLSLPAQFDAVAQAINRLPSQAQRVKVATELFGAAGAKAVASYRSGDLATAARLMGRNAMELAQASKSMALIHDAWERIKRAGEVFFNTIAARIAPILQSAVTKLEALLPKVQEWADRIGNAIRVAVAVAMGLFEEGRIGEALRLSFEIALRWLADALLQTVIFIGRVLGHTLVAAGKLLASPGLVDALVATAKAVGTTLYEAGNILVRLLTDSNLYKAIWAGMKYAMSPVAEAFGSSLAEKIEKVRLGLMAVLHPKEAEQAAEIDRYEAMRKSGRKMGTGDTEFEAQAKRAQEAMKDPKTMAFWRQMEKVRGLLGPLKNVEVGIAADSLKQLEESTGKVADKLVGMWDVASTKIGDAAGKAREAWKGVKWDVAPFNKTMQEIGKMWRESGVKMFTDPTLVAKLQKLIADAQKKGEQILAAQKKADAAPGGGRVVRPGFGGEGAYDEFRRIGGGLSSAVVNIQQRMYDKLALIANTSAQQVGLTQRLVDLYAGGKTLPAGAPGRSGLDLRGVQ